MKTPYHELPFYTRWSKAVAAPSYQDVDPVVNFPWKIEKTERVATAGSCFAQHIARHLANSGFNYYVVEDGHPLGTDDDKRAFNYGTFSGRYGNVYTSRQLVQLFQRAFGTFNPVEPAWTNGEGRVVDPFRPNIQPHGFFNETEMLLDRAQHLLAVKEMFETTDVFVFTLGLTETWRSKTDGAVFPVCPGVAGGTFDWDQYEFLNLSVFDVIQDMKTFLSLLTEVNPSVRVILTVSPVPLMATAEDEHVLVATTHSKSILRVVCGELVKHSDQIAYFPSYEIITGAYARGRYFGADLRSVVEDGVSHVMRLFLQHAANVSGEIQSRPSPPAEVDQDFLNKMQKIVQTTCDEELIEASLKK